MFDKKNLFPLILAAGFISTTAFAQAAPAPTAEQKAARAEIETLTKRIEELAKKLDGNTKVQVMVVEKSAAGESRFGAGTSSANQLFERPPHRAVPCDGEEPFEADMCD